MKKLLSIFITATLLSVFTVTALPGQIALAAEYIVAKDNTGDFTTIQDAINHASSGDTITVKPGTYQEWIKVTKPLILQGEDRDTTILKGTFGPLDGITVKNISGVTIRNFTLREYRFNIYLENSHNNIITNNNLEYSSTYPVDYCGIRTSNADNNLIINNIFRDNEFGVYLHTGSEGNIIENNAFYGNTNTAICLNSSSNNRMQNNLVENNGYGIVVGYNSNHNTVENNIVSGNSMHGIRVFRSSHVTISGNTVIDNSLHGIFFCEADYCSIVKNIIKNNGSPSDTRYRGISFNIESVLFDNIGNTIAGNVISDHPQEGIKLFRYTYDTVIKNNTIENNKYGLEIYYAENTLIYNNNFINNPTQAKDRSNGSSVFNLSKPEGGNYWSNWNSPDADMDGFVDIPYQFTFFAADNLPWANRDGWTMQQNRPPVADIGLPYESTENFPVDFNAGGSSDPDGDPLQFRWDLDGDGEWDTLFSDSPIYDGFFKADDYDGIVRVEVTDGKESDIDETTVTFTNLAPITDILEAEPENAQCYQTPITFRAIGKDPGWDDLTFEWDFGDGSGETSYAPGGRYDITTSHTYSSGGVYKVTLTVRDDDGGETSNQTKVYLKDNIKPEVFCEESVNPHGNTIPGEERDKNGKDKNNRNPDGFYRILGTDNCDSSPEIYIGTADNPFIFGPFESGIVIKFTEAPGAVPSIKKIGSTNGQAGAVIWHITLPSDPLVTVIDEAGNVNDCGTCLVPPPPM